MTYSFPMESFVLNNDKYRVVAYTDGNLQMVAMCLYPGEYIPMEVHIGKTQVFQVFDGVGRFVVNGEDHVATRGHSVVVPPGVQHYVANAKGDERLKLLTIYSPPEHEDRYMQDRM